VFAKVLKSTIYARLLLMGRSFYAIESIAILKKIAKGDDTVKGAAF